MIKKTYLYLMLALFSLSSCNLEEELDTFKDLTSTSLKVQKINLPSNFLVGEEAVFKLDVIFPGDCFLYERFDYKVNGDERIIEVISSVTYESNCILEEEIKSLEFKFKPLKKGNYIFKFYKGLDDQGNKTYLVEEIKSK